ncbi:GDSL esterase/lipase [Canna indica]|uniref:GDSL esterase/lipase n=1 Tax=Canna indica TaxID=4628 RepID=A0AAQ3Q2F9_9LILI|nr:GDSL esterase/lipase [Canna indica]
MAKALLTIFLLFFAFSSFVFPFCACTHGAAQAKGMFVFGSSLVDNGNNNFLRNSKARADFEPYGIDFPWGPSGRFSNGRNPIDVLGELLKLPSLIPPFADPRTKGRRIIHGVNYASGGSGILDQTGSATGEVMSLNSQIKSFEDITLPELKFQLGFRRNSRHRHHELSNHHLSKYLFVIGTGGNDYLLNYFRRDLNNRTTLSDFTQSLVSTLSSQLKVNLRPIHYVRLNRPVRLNTGVLLVQKLYDLGARKFVLFSVQVMGCVPVVRANVAAANGTCVEVMNEAAVLFNSHLRRLAGASRRRTQMPGSSVVYVNSYKIIRDIIENPTHSGFSETSKACCELSAAMEDGKGILCRRGGRACDDRSSHVFFDGLHPTDAVNARIAHKAYGSYVKAEAYPMNVQQLAKLSI